MNAAGTSELSRLVVIDRLEVGPVKVEGKEETTVLPCGACEKCRRIVGMLLAVGQDPKLCGFRGEQIESSLRSLVENGVHQERAGAAHMAHLLYERGRISEPRLGKVAARPQPEVMKLRFDPERSPLNGVPVSLREPIFRILLQHAEGALQRSGRVWHAFDVLGAVTAIQGLSLDEIHQTRL